jgi:hypothetical protein
MNALLLLLTLAPAAAPQAPALPQTTLVALPAPAPEPIAPPLPATPCPCIVGGPCTCGDTCPCGPADYGRIYRRCVAEGRPLVVWVGSYNQAAALDLPDCLHYRSATFQGVTGAGVVVGRPTADGFPVVGRLAAGATAAQVRQALAPKAAPQPIYQPVPVFYQPAFFGGSGGRCGPGG